MALKSRSRGVWWSRLHFLIRFAGLTGLLAVLAGAALLFRYGLLHETLLRDWHWMLSILKGEGSSRLVQVALTCMAAGAALAALALFIELLTVTSTMLGRRGAFGFNATLQTLLAVALIAGVNWFSFQHYARFDWTRAHQFTLPVDIQNQLKSLKDPTTIVVYQRHKTAGQINDKPDAFDYAAERKVVEKVHDIIDQFREFGPQFKVSVLDVEEEGYNAKLEKLARENKGLQAAIDNASENCIFFCANDRVQQLSFSDYYFLNKNESQKEKNLVLLDQGVEPFARRVLNVDEKKPRVGLLVIHEFLTTMGPEEFGLAGLKKTLTAQGFEVEDVILKKWSEIAPPEPAAYSYDESKLDRIEEHLAEVEGDLKGLRDELRDMGEVQKLWRTAKLEDLTKAYSKQLGGRKVDEAMRARQLAFFDQQAAVMKLLETQAAEERKETLTDRALINVDFATEQRRMTDVKAKLSRILASCDLVIIPRMTIRNVIIGDRIPNAVYKLDKAQTEAIKSYLAAGKPLLACLGPSSEHPSDQMREMQMGPAGSDELESFLAEAGIKLNKQTILHNAESKSFAERRTGLLVSGAAVEIPPVEFEHLTSKSSPLSKNAEVKLPPNPIRASMDITANSLGRKLDIKVPDPRPVYFESPTGQKPAFEPEFMITSAATWNDDQPFPTQKRTPRFEPPKGEDPAKGTFDEKRRGPFPIAVAVEVPVPAAWQDSKDSKPEKVRLAVIGSGGIFVGQTLSPAREQLLLDTCNWLLGRDDLLPTSKAVWKYPRVVMAEKDESLWRWAGWLVPPGLLAYAGLVVLLIRRLR
jgi:hypothetical protein